MGTPRALPTGTVTFLFTDIEGSTRLSHELGNSFPMVIDRHHAIMREGFAFCDGTVVSTEGDAFFAVFTNATAAVTGTATVQRALDAESWPGSAKVRVRMGLHTGEGRLGGDNYAGIDVNLAARVADAAHGGQVLLSRSAVDALGGELPDGVGMMPLGEVLLKDIPQPQPVAQLEIDGLPSEFPPLRADRPGWLPDLITSFLGRGPELTSIAGHLENNRLVTLTGPGGTGKTRLSIEAARAALPRFPGGAWFVALDQIHDPHLVLPEIADLLGVREQAGRSMLDVLAERIGSKRTLLVLDNLEQVVAVGPAVHDLLAATPGLHIIASSREALRISGEQEYPVPVLDADLAVLLFIERARKVRPDLETSPEVEADIRDIVDRLDALPLAIELAAARIRLFSPRKLRQRLENSLTELASGNRELPERQRTLRGAIEWSHGLLDEFERDVFARLAVFRGSGALETAEEILDPDRSLGGDVLEGIAALADKSLVIIGDGPDDDPRLRMLDSISDYAAERLAEDPGAPELRERHAEHLLAFAEKLEHELSGARPGDAYARAEVEHDNLRAAIDWSIKEDTPALGLRIAGAIWRFWQQRSHMAEGREAVTALLDHPSARDDACAMGRGGTALGGMAYWQDDQLEAKRAYEAALENYRECGDRAGEAHALFDLSYPTAILGDMAAAGEMGMQSLAIYAELDDRDGIALVREAQATMAIMAGDLSGARPLQEEVVDIRREQAGVYKLADSAGLLAIIEALLGDAEAARKHSDEAYLAYLHLDDTSGFAGGLQVEALVALAEGTPERAAVFAGAFQALRDSNDKILIPSEALRFPDPGERAREQLGEAFDGYFEEGRRLTPVEAFEQRQADILARTGAGSGSAGGIGISRSSTRGNDG